eukprot:Opistho-2@30018
MVVVVAVVVVIVATDDIFAQDVTAIAMTCIMHLHTLMRVRGESVVCLGGEACKEALQLPDISVLHHRVTWSVAATRGRDRDRMEGGQPRPLRSYDASPTMLTHSAVTKGGLKVNSALFLAGSMVR